VEDKPARASEYPARRRCLTPTGRTDAAGVSFFFLLNLSSYLKTFIMDILKMLSYLPIRKSLIMDSATILISVVRIANIESFNKV
jgi:hypothetical protein